MKVIKEGIKDKNKYMRIKCGGCEAELEIEANDIMHEDRHSYFTTCACCKETIFLYEGQIPHSILNRVIYRET